MRNQRKEILRQRPKPKRKLFDFGPPPDFSIRKRLFVTIGIVLVFRFLAQLHIPVLAPLSKIIDQNEFSRYFIGFVTAWDGMDFFSGGAFSAGSLIALGVFPSLLAKNLLNVFTRGEFLPEGYYFSGQYYKKKLGLTAILATLGAAVLVVLVSYNTNTALISANNLQVIAWLVLGSVLMFNLAFAISYWGISSNGESILILAGILALFAHNAYYDLRHNTIWRVAGVGAIFTVLVAVLVNLHLAQRRIPVDYGRRTRSRKVYKSPLTYIPIRFQIDDDSLAIAFGYTIIIFGLLKFASSIFPGPLAAIADRLLTFIGPSSTGFYLLYFFFVIFSSIVVLNNKATAQSSELSVLLQQQGGWIPGIRPGKRTAAYLKAVIQRINRISIFVISLIALLPLLIGSIMDRSPEVIEVASLLFVVNVMLSSIVSLIDENKTKNLMKHYEPFID